MRALIHLSDCKLLQPVFLDERAIDCMRKCDGSRCSRCRLKKELYRLQLRSVLSFQSSHSYIRMTHLHDMFRHVRRVIRRDNIQILDVDVLEAGSVVEVEHRFRQCFTLFCLIEFRARRIS